MAGEDITCEQLLLKGNGAGLFLPVVALAMGRAEGPTGRIEVYPVQSTALTGLQFLPPRQQMGTLQPLCVR